MGTVINLSLEAVNLDLAGSYGTTSGSTTKKKPKKPKKPKK